MLYFSFSAMGDLLLNLCFSLSCIELSFKHKTSTLNHKTLQHLCNRNTPSLLHPQTSGAKEECFTFAF